MWYSWISDAFPVRAMVLIAIVVGGFVCFDGIIRDKVHDIKEVIRVTTPASKPVVKMAMYVPEKGSNVYDVCQEDGRLLLI